MSRVLRDDEANLYKMAFKNFEGIKGDGFDRVLRSSAWENQTPSCKTQEHIDKGTFRPTKGESSEEARKLCFACPLFFVCLEHTLLSMNSIGTAAGLATRERDNLKYTIGRGILSEVSTLYPGSTQREEFFEVLKIVAGAYPLREVSIEETQATVAALNQNAA